MIRGWVWGVWGGVLRFVWGVRGVEWVEGGWVGGVENVERGMGFLVGCFYILLMSVCLSR